VERPEAQIADWLEKLGLEQYAKLFADNDIDFSVLPHLSDQDLKDLGVSLGHRRKIFAAINKSFGAVQPLAEAERPEEPKTPETPERRYVTVLFSDLVGSTALSLASIPKICATLSPSTKDASKRPCAALTVSSQSFWAMAFWSILDIQRRTKTIQSRLSAQDLSWSLQ
jgi:hypothetical protein